MESEKWRIFRTQSSENDSSTHSTFDSLDPYCQKSNSSRKFPMKYPRLVVLMVYGNHPNEALVISVRKQWKKHPTQWRGKDCYLKPKAKKVDQISITKSILYHENCK